MPALIIALALAMFLLANVAAYRVLVRVHPRRRGGVIALVVVGNAMWGVFPWLNARTDFSRFVRRHLGRPLIIAGVSRLPKAWPQSEPHQRGMPEKTVIPPRLRRGSGPRLLE